MVFDRTIVNIPISPDDWDVGVLQSMNNHLNQSGTVLPEVFWSCNFDQDIDKCVNTEDDPEPHEVFTKSVVSVQSVGRRYWIRWVRKIPSIELWPRDSSIEEKYLLTVHQFVIQFIWVGSLLHFPLVEDVEEAKSRGEVENQNKNPNWGWDKNPKIENDGRCQGKKRFADTNCFEGGKTDCFPAQQNWEDQPGRTGFFVHFF